MTERTPDQLLAFLERLMDAEEAENQAIARAKTILNADSYDPEGSWLDDADALTSPTDKAVHIVVDARNAYVIHKAFRHMQAAIESGDPERVATLFTPGTRSREGLSFIAAFNEHVLSEVARVWEARQ